MDYKIEEKSKELAQLILDSEEYQGYLEAKENLYRNPERAQRIQSFRKKNFEVQNGCDSSNVMEELMKLTEEYQQDLEYVVVSEYLNAELRLCKVMQNVNRILVEGINMNMDFLNQ